MIMTMAQPQSPRQRRLLAIHPGVHDGAACAFDGYDLVAAVQQERLTRKKGDGGGIPQAAIDEVLAIAGWAPEEVDALATTRAAFPFRFFSDATEAEIAARAAKGKTLLQMADHLGKRGHMDADKVFHSDLLRTELGLRPDVPVHFANHHKSHALPCLFYTDWDDALLFTHDGGGDLVHGSVRIYKNGTLVCPYGDDAWSLEQKRIDSLALAYGFATAALGYRMNRHEGKLTGLAAFGQPTQLDRLAAHWQLDGLDLPNSDLPGNKSLRALIEEAARDCATPADMAASIQALLEQFLVASVQRWVEKAKVRHLGLAGGVFANVRLNRLLAESTGVDEVFVFPAMGDEGLPIGAALSHRLETDGLLHWLEQRRRLDTVRLGRDFDADMAALLGSEVDLEPLPGDPAQVAADLLAAGGIGALYSGRMEYGPRALGARSILASPADRAVNQTLNDRLARTEFMPFAPYVLAEDAAEVFEVTPVNRYACRFMTITCAVKPEWIEKIPAVVHVDGTARPQVIDPEENPLYAAILRAFKARTGLPVLVDTSFNAHEEPIINRPEEALAALRAGRIDFLITEAGVVRIKAVAKAGAKTGYGDGDGGGATDQVAGDAVPC